MGEVSPESLAAMNGTTDGAKKPSGSAGRWWFGVAVGILASLPLAWLLSYGASLPFYLGLFFFALFGLVIGAVTFRVAAPGRPFGRVTLMVGTTLIVVVGWGLSIVNEARGLPHDLAENAVERTRDLGGRTRAEFVGYVAEQIQDRLRDQYPPGGTIGYVRWVLAVGEFERGTIDGVKHTLSQPQKRWWWGIRVVLSIVLFGFGIGSQTFLLRHRVDPAAVRVGDGAPMGV